MVKVVVRLPCVSEKKIIRRHLQFGWVTLPGNESEIENEGATFGPSPSLAREAGGASESDRDR